MLSFSTCSFIHRCVIKAFKRDFCWWEYLIDLDLLQRMLMDLSENESFK